MYDDDEIEKAELEAEKAILQKNEQVKIETAQRKESVEKLQEDIKTLSLDDLKKKLSQIQKSGPFISAVKNNVINTKNTPKPKLNTPEPNVSESPKLMRRQTILNQQPYDEYDKLKDALVKYEFEKLERDSSPKRQIKNNESLHEKKPDLSKNQDSPIHNENSPTVAKFEPQEPEEVRNMKNLLSDPMRVLQEVDDDLKNFLMQRSNAEYSDFKACQDLLNGFFKSIDPENLLIKDAKQNVFTPALGRCVNGENLDEKDENFDENPQLENSPKTNKNKVNTIQKDPEKCIIRAENLTHLAPPANKPQIAELLKEYEKQNAPKDQPIEITKLTEKQQLLKDAADSFGRIKDKMWFIEQLMADRLETMKKLYLMHNIDNINEQLRKTENGFYKRQKDLREQGLTTAKKKYKVDFKLLQKRDQMTRLEIMDRRFKMMK